MAGVQKTIGNWRLDARKEIWVEIRDLGSLEFGSGGRPRSPNKNVYRENRGGGQDTDILLKLSRGKEASKGRREQRTVELGMISWEPREESRES